MEVKLGTFASGAPRTQVYSWSSCKPANLREEGYTKFRKNLGRKPTKPSPSKEPEAPAPTVKPPGSLYPKVDSEGNEVSSNWSPRPGPGNCNFGPVITKEMLDQWHEVSPPGSPPVPPDPSQSKPSPHQGPVTPTSRHEDSSPGITTGSTTPTSSTGRPVRATRNQKPTRYKD